jgi:hypothetical protein
MQEMMPFPSALLQRLLDDAALFPPANAPMQEAVPAHVRHRESWYGSVVGPFVCPDVRLGELAGVLGLSTPAFPVSVVVSRGPEAIAAATSEAVALGLRLVAVEVPLGPAEGSAERARTAVRAIAEQPVALKGYVEVPRGSDSRHVLDVLAGTPVAAKLRTGGLIPTAFPTEAEVASFLAESAARSILFKCTAGLHRMVRHRAEPEGFERQGVANLLVATAAAVAGASQDELIELLCKRNEGEVVALLEGLDDVAGMRQRFRSLGTCSVEEPVEDLVRLGVLTQSAPASATAGGGPKATDS